MSEDRQRQHDREKVCVYGKQKKKQKNWRLESVLWAEVEARVSVMQRSREDRKAVLENSVCSVLHWGSGIDGGTVPASSDVLCTHRRVGVFTVHPTKKYLGCVHVCKALMFSEVTINYTCKINVTMQSKKYSIPL